MKRKNILLAMQLGILDINVAWQLWKELTDVEA